MESTKKPRADLAKKTLPRGLWQALKYIFNQNLTGTALVGGTALSGFYASHRQSDDLDLFTRDKDAQNECVLTVKSLSSFGSEISDERQTPGYYRGLFLLENHRFTIDVVMDENIHREGIFHKAEENIVVASLETLFMAKVATLVSRCSEKDLYDLFWLFKNLSGITMKEMLESGRRIDSGVSGESILISLSGTALKSESCGFAKKFGFYEEDVFKEINLFKKELEKNLSLYLHKSKANIPLAELVKKLK